MNRRDFLITSALVLASGKILGDVCYDQYQKGLLKEQKEILHNIYNELPKHVYLSKTTAKVRDEEEKINTCYGIIINNHYLTCAHNVNMSVRWVRTPFGPVETALDVISQKTELKDKELEQIVMNVEEDMAIYKLPKDLTLPDFPCKPSSKRNLGDEVFLIGNPFLQGWNIRRGHISDIDQYGNEPMTPKCFGTDFPGIPGDSGCPVVNSNYELLGIQAMHIHKSVGYAKKIEEFLKYINGGNQT